MNKDDIHDLIKYITCQEEPDITQTQTAIDELQSGLDSAIQWRDYIKELND